MYLIYSLCSPLVARIPDGFSVIKEKMKFNTSFHSFLWSLLKWKGFYFKYSLIDDCGNVVSYAEVINSCPLLRFLPQGAIHIGPCYTPPTFRGNGYYPCLIRYIAGSYKGINCFMFVHESNMASIRGIEKAGFVRVGSCKKFLNIYY